MNVEEKCTNYETLKHIQLVQHYIHTVVKHLIDRGENHDKTKLDTPELEAFTRETPKLNSLTFGTPEYTASLKALGPALDHHYAHNRHHPQHFKNGIDDMNLIDIVEMFCDWSASCQRHNDGNIRKSIEHNGKRFDISPQLVHIFENTINVLGL